MEKWNQTTENATGYFFFSKWTTNLRIINQKKMDENCFHFKFYHIISATNDFHTTYFAIAFWMWAKITSRQLTFNLPHVFLCPYIYICVYLHDVSRERINK